MKHIVYISGCVCAALFYLCRADMRMAWVSFFVGVAYYGCIMSDYNRATKELHK